ncbi:hypothetical protein Tco_0071999 [Tanacetum coccineum]
MGVEFDRTSLAARKTENLEGVQGSVEQEEHKDDFSQTNVIQCDWFSHVSAAMQSYAQCFNGSVPLRSICFTGNGTVAVCAVPRPLPVLRDWLYPADNAIETFLPSRLAPLRVVPSVMQIVFQHAHYTLPKEAEQYAILTQVNF